MTTEQCPPTLAAEAVPPSHEFPGSIASRLPPKPESLAIMNGDSPELNAGASGRNDAIFVPGPDQETHALGSVAFTLVALVLPKVMTPDQWVDVGRTIATSEKARQFVLGDFLLDADRRWPNEGEREALLAQVNLAPQTKRNAKHVAKCIPPAVRDCRVSWSKHQCIVDAGILDPEEQRKWLKRAHDEHLSRAQLRRMLNGGSTRKDKPGRAGVPHEVNRLSLDDLPNARKFMVTVESSLPSMDEVENCTDKDIVDQWLAMTVCLREFCAGLQKRLEQLADLRGDNPLEVSPEERVTEADEDVANPDRRGKTYTPDQAREIVARLHTILDGDNPAEPTVVPALGVGLDGEHPRSTSSTSHGGKLPKTEPGSIAEMLNQGRKIHWPRRANAIRIRLPGGKCSVVLKGNEDTLRDACGEEKAIVQFGFVPFDSKGRPKRERFKALDTIPPTTGRGGGERARTRF